LRWKGISVALNTELVFSVASVSEIRWMTYATEPANTRLAALLGRQEKAGVQGMHTSLRIRKKRRIASPHRSAKGPWRANQPARFAP